ncbi:AraC family transcriptional regulator [Gordonia insulae]|uniref:HTH-type transcriptional activator RhaS n=1 Tax=Gordonia insulae TaxID=2420509 RepID=A0A3G8JM31_9ACTN|nr:AraC family transcriptional regulator [Gordonia insulae]AZG46137.1 HTH-type transcriptional activator RhaS [Gordonia insulae]
MKRASYTRDGIDHDTLARWRSSIGADDDPGPSAATPMELRGRTGLAAYGAAFSRVTVDDPDAFHAIIYHRPLSVLSAHCELSTPRTTERTDAIIRAQPAPIIMVGTHRLEGRLRVRQGDVEREYGEGQLVVMSIESAFVDECPSVCDTALLLVPAEVLRHELAEADAAFLPTAADSLLARATATFIRRFVCDAAVRGLPITPADELAVVGLIRAAIGHHTQDAYQMENNALFVLEAARDLIDERYADPDFTADAIAEALQISRRHLYRHFADTGESPATMITSRRLAQARTLLELEEPLGLDTVAHASGFASAATLRNRFRAEFGMTPGAFRATVRSADDEEAG